MKRTFEIEEVANGVTVRAVDDKYTVVYQKTSTMNDADIYAFSDFLFYMILAYAPKRVVQDLSAPKIQILVNTLEDSNDEVEESCLQ